MSEKAEARKPPTQTGQSDARKTSLVLSEGLRIQAKHYALDHKMTLGELIDAALKAYIAKR